MNDLQTRRKFLKKTELPTTLDANQFLKGSTIVLLSRKLKLVDYADTATRRLLEEKEERITLLVTPSHFESIGDIVTSIESEDYALVDVRSLCCSSSDLYDAELLLGMELQDICSSSEHPFVALSFRGCDSMASVTALVKSSPFCHGVVCPQVGKELEFADFFLNRQHATTATLEECTCCIIRPHILKEHKFGAVVTDILSRRGFVIAAMQTFRLDKETAADFLAVYKGVFPQYVELVDEMCSGPLVAMEVKMDHTINRDVVEEFRAEAGAWDYAVACELHPQSIRARFGKSTVANAVHVTDLPKDGVIECEYFFKVLSSRHGPL